ncbi:hypothetical protein K5E_21410 [Enterococcus thailandicus]|uniref:hypothetical protein n=1 Tax=Enterococcus thailandicus TaxID=417368 RepID=UPI00244D8F1A|nr:hypothetical protein [Enterococcus thailandicus]GMC03123.1 hypothetical protein K4E_06410 [Enterococcus thailandicus]GMC10002.1 hypothetical protein K5E_21410 [Enterococcus thailandicus]
MRTFKILSSNKIYNISQKNFEELTDKKYPYCQLLNGKIRYFALCPSCNNPINFINLYSENKYEKSRQSEKRSVHGRHFTQNVPGLAIFDSKSYENCSLHSKNATRLYSRKPSKSKNMEVVKLMQLYREQLRYSISSILGIKVSRNIFEKFITDFINVDGFYFPGISKLNLPFYFLFLLPNEVLYNCIITDNYIKDSINLRSKYFKVTSDNRLKKTTSKFVEFEFVFINHQNNELGESLTYELIERVGNKKNILMKKKVLVDHTLFFNKIS